MSSSPSHFENQPSDASLAETHEEAPKQMPATRFAAGFWDRDPETTTRRTTYIKILALGSFLTTIVIFAVLGIYWGALWKVNEGVHNMNAWIVDFDQGAIGQAVTAALLNATGPKDQLSWQVVNASQFVNGPSDLVDAVVNERCWVAVTINPGATNTLNTAITNADGSYNGSLAVTAYTVEARNENSYPIYILPNILTPLNMAAMTFSTQNSQKLAASSPATLQTLLSRAPSVITQPLYYTVANVRPFDVPVASAVDFVGLIYLLIIAFIVSMMNFNARVIRSGLGSHLRMSSLLGTRVIVPLVLYFFLSWFYALLSLAFQTPFNRTFGHSGFVIFWAMSWLGMSALGLTMEAMITLLTPVFVPFFLVLWIICNVSVCYYPIEILPAVFRYGYATPFYNVSRTVRTIIFNTRNEVGLNFGVQFAWIAISLITIPTFQYIKRRGEEKEWHKQQNKEKV